jgi:toxin YoeB
MKINWEPGAWDEYVDWQTTDKAMLKRINRMIKQIQRTPLEGIGKPEPLKHDLSGYWSRRFDDANRLVYKVENDVLTILECRGHYRQH